MIYLKSFTLLDEKEENDYVLGSDTRNIYNNYYPLNIFSSRRLKNIKFGSITCFYGGNGSGKSTILNIISEKLNSNRKTEIDKGSYFNIYVKYTSYEMGIEQPISIKTINSDDVFDYLLDIRSINSHINRRKEKLSKEFLENKYSNNSLSFEDFENLRDSIDSKRKTMSKYVRDRLVNNIIIESSNGESALMFWEKEIEDDSIYILDEPENSLSAENQIKLMKFIEDSVRFYNCQFIISTHSPFFLSMKDAVIYDLDTIPVITRKWTELENVKIYKKFFDEHSSEFKEE
ncbi:MAG: AAA family ATPase [Tenericutes bacterium]|nr:AAA family ATPase [Mycoplasmatota bacterium]